MTEPRWRVTISNVTGDRSLLESTLAAAGFDLDGDMLSGEKFEKHDTPNAVRDVADDIARKIRELARLIPDFDMGFDAGPVHEYDDDGTEHVHDIARIRGATTLGLAGTVATLSDGSKTPEEQAKIKRQEVADRAATLIRAVIADNDVLAVLKLLDGEADSTAIYKVYEIIGDDLKRKIYMLASKDELKRFTGSLNHPSASGDKARHARLKSKPPKNPMTEGEWRVFAETLADGWIKEKAAP